MVNKLLNKSKKKDKGKTIIIAEVGVNHDGSFDKAKKLIRAAKNCKADYVKFQTFNQDNLIIKNHKKTKPLFSFVLGLSWNRLCFPLGRVWAAMGMHVGCVQGGFGVHLEREIPIFAAAAGGGLPTLPTGAVPSLPRPPKAEAPATVAGAAKVVERIKKTSETNEASVRNISNLGEAVVHGTEDVQCPPPQAEAVTSSIFPQQPARWVTD